MSYKPPDNPYDKATDQKNIPSKRRYYELLLMANAFSEGADAMLEALKKQGTYCHPQGRGLGWLVFIEDKGEKE